MAYPNHGDRRSPKPLVKRLDRWAGEMNAFLIVLALGLAVLDLTCYTALEANSGASSSSGTHIGLGKAAMRAANLAP